MKWAQENDKTTVLTIPSDAYEWTPGDAAWDVGVPEVSDREAVNEARKDHDSIRSKQRIGVQDYESSTWYCSNRMVE